MNSSILLCLLFLGASQGFFGKGPGDQVAMLLVKTQISAIMDAYTQGDQVTLNHLMEASTALLPTSELQQLDIFLAKHKSINEVNAYGTFDNNIYAMRMVKNVSSPTTWYMSLVTGCQIGDCF